MAKRPLFAPSGTQRKQRKLSSHCAAFVRYLTRTQGVAWSLPVFFELFGGGPFDAKLENRISEYIISPRTQIRDPAEMPVQHLALAVRAENLNSGVTGTFNLAGINDQFDNEAFLMRLWAHKCKTAEPSTFNAEIYNGPWMDLLNSGACNRLLLVFVILNCDVFKWCSQTQTWQCLSRTFDMSPFYTFQRYKKNPEPPFWDYVLKNDIMYRHKGRNEEYVWDAGRPYLRLALNSTLRNNIEIIYKRLKRYTKLALTDRISRGCNCKEKGNNYFAVGNLVMRTLYRLIPRNMLGSKNNHTQFKNGLCSVFLPNRYRTYTKHLLKGIKASEIPWLRNVEEKDQQLQLQLCVSFLYNVVVKHILQLHFYITEMSGAPIRQVFYYDQTFWLRQMERPATRTFLKTSTDENEQAEENTHNKYNQALTLRFVPKKDNSMRPIINLRPLNTSLVVPHLVLGVHTNPLKLNAWALKLEDFRTRHANEKFYVAKVDISACYDNANRGMVERIVQNKVNGCYIVNNEAHLDVYKKKLKVLKIAREASFNDESKQLTDYAVPINRKKLMITFERPPYSLHTGPEIYNAVRKLLNHTYLKTGRSVVKFGAGIPQGSICSLDLCNLLLDALINEKLTEYTQHNNSMLFRYVDDFLFVSTDPELVYSFAQTMETGFPEYGVMCNPQKVYCSSRSSTENINSNVNENVVFLGTGIDPKSLKLLPLPLPPVDNDMFARGNMIEVKRRLDADMEKLLAILRAFHKAGIPIPAYLELRIAKLYGSALKTRIKAAVKVYGNFYDTVQRRLLPLVTPSRRRIVKRTAMKAFKAI